jgi:hypothetical protein
MKEIVSELKLFIRKDFNLPAYGFTIIFLAVVLTLNFHYNFEKTVINSFYAKPIGYLVYFLYYYLPYIFIVIITLSFKKRLYKIRQKEFIVKSFVFIAVFAFMTAFHHHKAIADAYSADFREYNYLLKILGNLKRILPFIIIFAVVKYFYDKEDKHLYGLQFARTNYRPYFIMLLLLIPLITFASFTDSFQYAYPRMKPWQYPDVFELEYFEKIFLFEMAYGLDFVSIELMFRGALVIGMARCLKEDSVLPMAALYVIIHFGKPPLEAISSFFGGFILGAHSYYSKHILGGIIVHIGLAWLMEFAAHLQHYFD